MFLGLPALFKGEAAVESRQNIFILLPCLAMSQQGDGGRSKEHLPHHSMQAGQEETALEPLARAEMGITDLRLEFIFPKGWAEYWFIAILLCQPNLGPCAQSQQISREKWNFHASSPSPKDSWLIYLLYSN